MIKLQTDLQQSAGIRALHLDLKGVPPTAMRLLRLLDIARESGYNAVLVEWEDQFPWSEMRFRCESCYSKDEVAAFYAKAAELGLEIIPLVQCIGHMETFLRLPEHAGLRENEKHPDVLNPLAPRALEHVEKLVDEILAASPPLRHFHLGGDEAWSFGTHPDTKAFIGKYGKGALYLKHVEPLLDKLLARGIRPILWHDMMVEWDDVALRAIGIKADICVWAYGRYDVKKHFWMNSVSERDQRSDLPVLVGGCRPIGEELFERFIEVGVTLWGAGAYKCGQGTLPHHPDLPVVEERLNNALDWARLAERFPLHGLIATAWSRGTTDAPQYQPIDAALDLLVANGLAWTGASEDILPKAAALLDKLGERTRFERCRELMERLTDQRKMTWLNVISMREIIAAMDADPRRRSTTLTDRFHGHFAGHIKAIETIERESKDAFDGLIPTIWLTCYFQERLAPLRQEYAELRDLLQKPKCCI